MFKFHANAKWISYEDEYNDMYAWMIGMRNKCLNLILQKPLRE